MLIPQVFLVNNHQKMLLKVSNLSGMVSPCNKFFHSLSSKLISMSFFPIRLSSYRNFSNGIKVMKNFITLVDDKVNVTYLFLYKEKNIS